MDKRWVEPVNVDKEKLDSLIHKGKLPPSLARIVYRRGVTDFEKARQFFNPVRSQLHDPFLMKDMDRAVHRIQQAMENKERILIYGDYDVDGTTAVALAYRFFKGEYSRVDFYIPDRYTEGYGISKAGIDWAREADCSLIIALDCGIKGIQQVAYAKSLGIDFIIGDHHMPAKVLPDAVAVLDPKRRDCGYPFKELSGCGIAFKLIQAFALTNHIPHYKVDCYLDLVAVSIAADIVPVTGENRVLAHLGLEKLNGSPCFGLAALKELASYKGAFTIESIVFQIGPRINAAGRIKHAKDAVKLLTSASLEEARAYSQQINLQNTERRKFDSQITEQALSMIRNDDTLAGGKTTVVYQNHWHKGVIGIVASRLTETYYRPTIVLTGSNGQIAGSARSVPGFDLYQALDACGDLLEQYGGHKYAAGLTMKEENIARLTERFESVVSASILPEMLVQELIIDQSITLDEVDLRWYQVLKRMAPFGPDNAAPIFLCKGVRVIGKAAVVRDKHLKMTVYQNGSHCFDCIAFNQVQYYSLVNAGGYLDICFSVEENRWRNKLSLQLNIKGIRQNTH